MDTYKVYIDLPSQKNICMPIGGNFYNLDQALNFVKEMQFTPSEVTIEREFHAGGTALVESFWLDDDGNIITNDENDYESE